MLSKKRAISLTLLVLFFSTSLMIAVHYSHNAFAKGKKVRILRRQDQRHVKPTAAEIADPANHVQDEPVSTPKEERELEDRDTKTRAAQSEDQEGKRESVQGFEE